MSIGMNTPYQLVMQKEGVMSKDKMIYKNLNALTPVEQALNEAGKALEDSSRTIESSEIPEVLGAAGGLVGGGAIGFAALYYAGVTGLSAAGITSGLATAGGLIGGGMVAGIGVLAAPAALLGIGGYAILSHINKKKLVEKKEMLLQQAMQKQNAIISRIKEETNANKERIDYMTSLNIVLQAIVRDLKADLTTAECIQGLMIAMQWSTAADFDLAAVYEAKDGKEGLVYFGELGDLNKFPFMQLSGDEGIGDKGGAKEETMQIAKLDDMKFVWILCWDYGKIQDGSAARFRESDVVLSVIDDKGAAYSVKLDTGDMGNVAVIATIDNSSPIGAKLENTSKTGTLKGLKTLDDLMGIIRS